MFPRSSSRCPALFEALGRCQVPLYCCGVPVPLNGPWMPTLFGMVCFMAPEERAIEVFTNKARFGVVHSLRAEGLAEKPDIHLGLCLG